MTMFFFFVCGSTVRRMVTLATFHFLHRREQVRERLAVEDLLLEEQIAERDDQLLVLREDLPAARLLLGHDLAHRFPETKARVVRDRLATPLRVPERELPRAELVVAEAELLDAGLRDVRRVLVVAGGTDRDVIAKQRLRFAPAEQHADLV